MAKREIMTLKEIVGWLEGAEFVSVKEVAGWLYEYSPPPPTVWWNRRV